MSNISLTPEELSDLIGLVYDSAFEEAQWHSFMNKICDMFPGVGSAVIGVDGENLTQRFSSVRMAGEDSNEPSKLNYSIKGMSVAQALRATPNGFVARTKKFIDENDWRQSGGYLHHLKSAGLFHAMHLKLDHNGDRAAVITFAVPEDPELEKKLHDPLFEVLKLLAPHAFRAGQLARALALAKKSTEVFSGFLDGIILPMLVTDVQGRYLFGNSAGRRVLERGDPFRQDGDGRLQLGEAFQTTDLHHRIALTDRNLLQTGMRVETDDTPLMLAISPFRPSMRDASQVDKHLLDEERMFAIFVGQSEQDAVNTGLLEDVFGLTKREAEVCKNLLSGEGVANIADSSGRSPKTVRNQIQMIYEKVGVSSNTELMDRLSVFRTVGTMFDGQSNALPDGAKRHSIGH